MEQNLDQVGEAMARAARKIMERPTEMLAIKFKVKRGKLKGKEMIISGVRSFEPGKAGGDKVYWIYFAPQCDTAMPQRQANGEAIRCYYISYKDVTLQKVYGTDLTVHISDVLIWKYLK